MLVVVLLLAAAWGTLHGWIVPRIGDFRVQLQQQAGRALGVPVRIGTLSARSDGLIPAIELGDVALLDAQGHTALLLPRVVVALSPRSLWRLGFEQLYIERPELDIRRTAEGRIFIAGLLFSDSNSGDTSAADWLLSQTEVVVRGGTLRWSDELRGAAPLALGEVDILLRNRNWRHSLRVDATPAPAWGERFTLMGRLRQPLLSPRSGDWQQWSGQLFADFPRVDAAQLRHYLDPAIDISIAQGHGAVRAWADVERGQVVGASADLALAEVRATLGQRLPALVMAQVQGRLSGRRLAGGFEASTHGLQFVTGDGLRWPGGNLRLQHTNGGGRAGQERSELSADRLDLAALAAIATRLPLGEAAHRALRTYAPQGQVEALQATWQGPFDAQGRYDITARVKGLSVADTPSAASAGVAGLRGAAVDVEMTQAGGKATLRVAHGALLLPGIFEDPVLAIDQLDTQVQWKIGASDAPGGPDISVQVAPTHFANADAQGQLRATWRTSDAATSSSGGRFPGVLDLSGTLSRANGTRVHRYLPLVIPAQARHYVRDGVLAGSASTVTFRVKGDLNDMPFDDPKLGEFRIAAQVQNATYAFVPPSVQPAGELPWPVLTRLSGELVFERSAMQVIGASGLFTGARNIHISKAQTQIADLSQPVVVVSAQARGPLPEFLDLVKSSPIDALILHALAQASASGSADLQLDLHLPIDDLRRSTVRGSVTLAQNDVRMTPDTPALTRARGVVQFTDSGFSLHNVQAQTLGGETRLEGGLQVLAANAAPSASALQLRAQGTASAQGLRQAKELGFLAQLAQHASGSTPYTLALTMRRGVPEMVVNTSLQGLAVSLPAPLGKSADSALPMLYSTTLTPESLVPSTNADTSAPLHEDITLDAGTLGSVRYVRDISSAAAARVLRGAIAIGLAAGEEAPLPESGVIANLNAAHIDVDAWKAALLPPPSPSHNGPQNDDASAHYLPSVLALRTDALTVQGRTLHDVVAGGTHDGAVWRANLDARELNGYVEYHQAGAARAPNGRVFARLSRLAVPPSADSADSAAVEALLNEQPGSLPALDIAVSDFHLRGRALGRLEIIATNHGSEGAQRAWHLQTFNLSTPEAALSANGNWALLGTARSSDAAQRRTLLNFQLDIGDSGALLERFGMADVIRKGKGTMRGQVAWRGAPLNPDYSSMTGQIKLNFEAGQFLKADPGLAKLLSVLSLQSLPRRLSLDFRDVFSQGFAFDFVRGDVTLSEGIASTNNLQMKGVNAAVLMEGSANVAHETQNLHVVVVPEINAMSASLVATAINPVVGLGSFLAQMFLRGPLMQAATQEFSIDGTWAEPRVERIARSKKGIPAAPAPATTTNTTTPPEGATE